MNNDSAIVSANTQNRILLNRVKIDNLLLATNTISDEVSSRMTPANFAIKSIKPVVGEPGKIDVVVRLDKLARFSEQVIRDAKVKDSDRYRDYRHRLTLVSLVATLNKLTTTATSGITKNENRYTIASVAGEVADLDTIASQLEMVLESGPLNVIKVNDSFYRAKPSKDNLKSYGTFEFYLGSGEQQVVVGTAFSIEDNFHGETSPDGDAITYYVNNANGLIVDVRVNGFNGVLIETFNVDKDNYVAQGTKPVANKNVFVTVYDGEHNKISEAKVALTKVQSV